MIFKTDFVVTDFHLAHQLGKGAYGVVHAVRQERWGEVRQDGGVQYRPLIVRHYAKKSVSVKEIMKNPVSCIYEYLLVRYLRQKKKVEKKKKNANTPHRYQYNTPTLFYQHVVGGAGM